MGKKISRTWIFTILILAGAGGMGAYYSYTQSLVVRTASAHQTSMASWVEEQARTSLPHMYHITMPMEGRVLPILLEEGDTITKGQVVVELEDIQWQETRLQTESILVAMENWVAASQAHVKASEISRDFNKWNWQAYEKLAAKKAISELTAKESRRSYLESEETNQESLANHQATVAFQTIVELVPAYVSRNLERTRVKSPKTGTVLKRHVWNEKVMTAGSPLLDIGNLSELEITADVLTQEAVKIRAGQRVEIFGETIGTKPIQGQVRQVAPNAFKKISSLGVEEQRVPVYITFKTKSLDQLKTRGRTLGLNYQVRVKIIIHEKNQTLTIPRTALFRGMDSTWQVYAIRQEKATLTRVSVGLVNDRKAEILSGLKAGDQVILAPESTIENGIRVSAIQDNRS